MKRQKDEPGSSTEKCHESYRQSQNTSSTQKSLGAARCRAGKGAEGEKEIARTPIRPSFLTHGWGPNLSAGNVAKIANLTSRDLYGQGPCPPDRTRREMPGKDSKGLRGEVQDGRSPSWGLRSSSAAERRSPFTCRDANK